MNRRSFFTWTVAGLELVACLGVTAALFLIRERSTAYVFCWIFLNLYIWMVAIRRFVDHD